MGHTRSTNVPTPVCNMQYAQVFACCRRWSAPPVGAKYKASAPSPTQPARDVAVHPCIPTPIPHRVPWVFLGCPCVPWVCTHSTRTPTRHGKQCARSTGPSTPSFTRATVLSCLVPALGPPPQCATLQPTLIYRHTTVELRDGLAAALASRPSKRMKQVTPAAPYGRDQEVEHHVEVLHHDLLSCQGSDPRC